MSSANAGAPSSRVDLPPGNRRVSLRAIVAAFLIVTAVLLGTGYLRARSFDAGIQPRLSGATALPVLLPDGSRAALGTMLKPGRFTVISLWASWCGYCRQEAQGWAALKRAHGADVNLMLINVRDGESTKQDKQAFLRAAGLPDDDYVVLDDSAMPLLTGASDTPVPRTMVYDRLGRPLARITGYKPLALDRIDALVGA